MADDPLPEPDRIVGVPHPRETLTLIGQAEAEAAFLDAFNRDKLHHAWLITGPRGVGKATLAWRIARFLLSQPPKGDAMFATEPPTTLDTPADHPVTRRTIALAEPGLFLLRRAWDDKKKALKTVITVDEARKLKDFFGLSAPGGGHRVVIIDSADEMNINTSNAILKLLEEPPANCTLLLISHTPSRLLPTIRSRCRTLRCATLAPGDLAAALSLTGETLQTPDALAELADGSVGEALRLTHLDGLKLYQTLTDLTDGAPNMDRARLLALAGTMVGRGAVERLDVTLRLLNTLMSRLARTGAGLPPTVAITRGETAMLHRLSPGPWAARQWADLQQTLSARAAHGRAVNLDPSALILDMGLSINQTAAQILRA
ncbi:DNA polymerase III subunit delta' [Oceaniglobus ichthyenteri]|uniref:DNA polymerase III subunit delta' n=1 Tax=Oceaniglobus ichthyenteri TaxID=2136177 RepID=UPI000D3665DC|nr:DNA polymerase III subunit delta' [Oceaniglobus ichthyenteri]